MGVAPFEVKAHKETHTIFNARCTITEYKVEMSSSIIYPSCKWLLIGQQFMWCILQWSHLPSPMRISAAVIFPLWGQLSVDIGSSFGGGLGPPNPIHSDTARPVKRPVTAPWRSKIKSQLLLLQCYLRCEVYNGKIQAII